MKPFLASALFAALMLTGAANTATAATLKAEKIPVVQPLCSTLSVTTSTNCQTVAGNNDSQADMNAFGAGAGVFGINSWIFADKDSDAASPFKLTSFPTGAKAGAWSVASFGGYQTAALVVKGGSKAWVAYLLDTSKLFGTWSTADIVNNGGNQPNLSHLSLYVSGPITPPSPVPVPAAGFLLLGALGIFGAAARRKGA